MCGEEYAVCLLSQGLAYNSLNLSYSVSERMPLPLKNSYIQTIHIIYQQFMLLSSSKITVFHKYSKVSTHKPASKDDNHLQGISTKLVLPYFGGRLIPLPKCQIFGVVYFN